MRTGDVVAVVVRLYQKNDVANSYLLDYGQMGDGRKRMRLLFNRKEKMAQALWRRGDIYPSDISIALSFFWSVE